MSILLRLSMPSCYTVRHRGYVTLISVLVVGAIGAVIATALILLGLGASRNGFAEDQSAQAKAAANACAEEAMERIRESSAFAGADAMAVGQGSCTFAVANEGGENRLITATGTVGTMVRKARIAIDRINPLIEVVSWEEVADH